MSRTGAAYACGATIFAEVELIGVELDPAASQYASEGFTILIGDQSDSVLLGELVEKHGPFDVVIDDGSHLSEHQLATLQALWPAVVPGGLYAVEDTHTSYFPRYHGGYRKPGAFMEYVKQVVDDPNQRWHQHSPLLSELESVQVYPELCVFTKARELIYNGQPPNEFTLNHLNEGTD